jgi:hypothetical protein
LLIDRPADVFELLHPAPMVLILNDFIPQQRKEELCMLQMESCCFNGYCGRARSVTTGKWSDQGTDIL